MKKPLYKFLVAVLICAVLLILYGFLEHLLDIYIFRASLPIGAILFQVTLLLIVFYKIAVRIKDKKPFKNLLGVALLLATLFIGATYLYIAIIEAISK